MIAVALFVYVVRGWNAAPRANIPDTAAVRRVIVVEKRYGGAAVYPVVAGYPVFGVIAVERMNVQFSSG